MIGDLQLKLNVLSGYISHELNSEPGLYAIEKAGTNRYVAPEALEDREADLESELAFMQRMHRQALQSLPSNDLQQDGVVAWIRGKLEEIVLVVVECESSPSTSGVHRSTWFVPVERTTELGKSRPLYVVSENWRMPVTTHINEVKLQGSLHYNAVRCPPCRYGVRLATNNHLVPLTDDGWDTAERVYRRMQVYRSIRTHLEDGEEQQPLFDRVVIMADLEVHIMSRAGVMVKYNLPRFHEEFDRVAMINRAELHKRLRMIAQAGREKTARVSLHRTRQGEASMIASAVRDDATLIPDTEMTFQKAKNKPPYLLCYDKRSGSYEIRMDGLPAWPSLYLDDKDRVVAADCRVKWQMTEFMHLGGLIEVRAAERYPGYVERPYAAEADQVVVTEPQSDQETQYFVRRFRQWVTSLPLNTLKIVGLADGQFSLLAVIKQMDTDAVILWSAASDWAKHYLQSDKAQFTKVVVWHGNDVVATLKREQIPGRVVITDRSVGKSTHLAIQAVNGVSPPVEGEITFVEAKPREAAVPIQDRLAAALSDVRCAVYNAYGLAPYKFTNFPLQLCVTFEGVELAEEVKKDTIAPYFLIHASGEIQLIFPQLEGAAGQKAMKELGGDGEETATHLSMAGWHYAAKQALRYSHTGAIPDGTGWLLFDNTRGAGQWQPTWIHSFATEQLNESAVTEFIRDRAELASTVLRWILISPVGDVYIVGSDMEKPVPAAEFFGLRWTERTVLSKGWHMPCKAGTVMPEGTKSLDELKAKLVPIPTGERRQCIVQISTDLKRVILQDTAVVENTSDVDIMLKMREIELGANDLCLVGLAPSGRMLFRYQADSMNSTYTEVTGEHLLQQGPENVKVLTQAFSQMIQTSFGKVRVRDWNGFLDKVAQVLRCSEAGVLAVGLWSTMPEDQRDREIKLLREKKTKLQLGVTQLMQRLQLITEPIGDHTTVAFSGNIDRKVIEDLCKEAGVAMQDVVTKEREPSSAEKEARLSEVLSGYNFEAELRAMQQELRGGQQVRGPIQVLHDTAVIAVNLENVQQANSVLTSEHFYIESLPFQLRFLVHRASEEQTRFEHKSMTTGHLLLGMLKAGTSLSNWLRIGYNVELRNARVALETAYKLMSPETELQYSPETLKCLRDAEHLAKEQKVPADESHLLEAILSNKDHMGCQVLDQLKVDRKLLIQQIREARKQTDASPQVYLEEQAYEQFTMTVPPGKQGDDRADALAAACLALSAYPGMEGTQFKEGFLKTAAADDLKKLLRDMTDVIVAHPACGQGEVPVRKYTDLLTERLDLLRDFDSAYCTATTTRLQLAGKAGKTNPEWLENTSARLLAKLEQLPPEKRTPIMAAICILDHEMHSKLAALCRTAAMKLPVLPFNKPEEPSAAFELLMVQESWASSLCRLRNSDLDELFQLVKQHYGVTQFLCDLTKWYNQYRGRRI